MQKPNGYDDAEPKVGGGDYPTLPAGGYVVKIVNAETKKSKSGNEMLVLSVDVAEGENAGFYTQLSERIDKQAYPNIYQLTEGEHTSYFKGLISAIEHSNGGFKFNFEEKSLIGKKLGVNLREEEYKNKEGEIKTILKVAYFCSAEEARAGLPVLKIKTLGSAKPSSSPARSQEPPKDDDLPF